MMSYETMRAMGEEAGRKSKQYKRIPATFGSLSSDAVMDRMKSIPNFGPTYVPKGWERVDVEGPRLMGCTKGYLFVDATGMGLTSEPALTPREFANWVSSHGQGYGFAIVEAGQFQVVIAAFIEKTKPRIRQYRSHNLPSPGKTRPS